MSTIIVNGYITSEGKFTISRRVERMPNGKNGIVYQGSFSSEQYLEEIESIETEHYLIDDISVYEEVFGSEEETILYNFTAKAFILKKEELDEDE